MFRIENYHCHFNEIQLSIYYVYIEAFELKQVHAEKVRSNEQITRYNTTTPHACNHYNIFFLFHNYYIIHYILIKNKVRCTFRITIEEKIRFSVYILSSLNHYYLNV